MLDGSTSNALFRSKIDRLVLEEFVLEKVAVTDQICLARTIIICDLRDQKCIRVIPTNSLVNKGLFGGSNALFRLKIDRLVFEEFVLEKVGVIGQE